MFLFSALTNWMSARGMNWMAHWETSTAPPCRPILSLIKEFAAVWLLRVILAFAYFTLKCIHCSFFPSGNGCCCPVTLLFTGRAPDEQNQHLPGARGKFRISVLTPDTPDQILHFNKILRWFACTWNLMFFFSLSQHSIMWYLVTRFVN